MKNRINVEGIFARTMEAAQSLFALAWLAVACIMEAFPPGAKITRTVIAFLARFHRVHPGRHVFYTVFTSLTRIWACMPVVCCGGLFRLEIGRSSCFACLDRPISWDVLCPKSAGT